METEVRQLKGQLNKMTAVHQNPVVYSLTLGGQTLCVNECLGKTMAITFLGEIYCIQCDRKIAKSFQQGYCFPCYRRLLECGLCIIHPERCLFYEGNCDPNDWAHTHCHQKHIVYLANSSGIKVGITRENNLINRWIDQGAMQGLPIFQVQNRYQAGVVEVALKQFINDKTNWQQMLKNKILPIDLLSIRDQLLAQAKSDILKINDQYPGEIVPINSNDIRVIEYPIHISPDKIKAFNLDKTPEIRGKLMGIKGQYLLLDTGVINIRKFGGYQVEVKSVN